jgi:chromosome segregation ATPase
VEHVQTTNRSQGRELEDVRQRLAQRDAVMDERVQDVRRAGEDRLRLAESKAASLQAKLDDAQKIILDHERVASTRRGEINKVHDEYESRIKMLQTRLDWYDSNVKREYETARDKVREEMTSMETQLKDATEKAQLLGETKERLVAAEEERSALRMELDQLRAEWKEVQHEMSAQIQAAQEKARVHEKQAEEVTEAKLDLEQELRQRTAQLQSSQASVEKKQDDLERTQKSVQLEQDKNQRLRHEIEEYKKLSGEHGIQDLMRLKQNMIEKEAEVEQLRQKLNTYKATSESLDEKEAIHRDKERVLRELVNEKEQTLAEFKNRIHVLERQVNEFLSERDGLEIESKKKMEKVLQMKQRELEERLNDQKTELEHAYRQEIEAAKLSSGAPAAPVDTAEIERQVRQNMENEVMDQLREKETSMEQKVKEINEEAKKEADKWRWENENLKEELRRAREARGQLEREAQELIQQAEVHYKNEFEKKMASIEAEAKRSKGVFSAIGKILDTPIIDTNKDKEDAA